jgi:GTP-binding protein HflX
MAEFIEKPNARLERAFLVGIQTAGMASGDGQELLAELSELVENLGIAVTSSTLVNLRSPTPKFLVGSGKAAELAEMARAEGAEVILEIFADRAHTREAILQVALARMQYSLPRLTRAWTHLSRQRGKGALGGEGETQLEQDRRVVRNRIAHLKAELAEVVQQRAVQRRRRLRVPVPTAAIVGYTNAGKSSLLNRLTGAHVLAEDKLFATLDPTTRQLALPGNRKVLLTDTVGFVRRLPHGLVEAFKATLEEVVVADFLIHVLDLTSPHLETHRETTLAVLAELGAADRPTITVLNKADLAPADTIRNALRLVPDAIVVSARTGKGLDTLVAHCLELISSRLDVRELLVPPDRYDVIAKLHRFGQVHHQEHRDDGVHLLGRFPDSLAGYFRPFQISAR